MLPDTPGPEPEKKDCVYHVEYDGVEECRDEGEIQNEPNAEIDAAVQKKREISSIAVQK